MVYEFGSMLIEKARLGPASSASAKLNRHKGTSGRSITKRDLRVPAAIFFSTLAGFALAATLMALQPQGDVTHFNERWQLKLGQEVSAPSASLLANDTVQMISIGLFAALTLAFIAYLATWKSREASAQAETDDHLRHFMKSTPIAVAMFDINMRYIKASDRWFQDYDLTEADVIGKSHYEIFPEVPVKHPKWLEMHWQAINGSSIQSEEPIVISADGERGWLRYELHPWCDDDGKLGGVIMLTENITARKSAEKLKDEFISNVNHELRTPLTSIHGALSLLKAKASGNLDAQARRLLDISYENCIRLTELVNDFLDMEKIAAGEIRVDAKPEEMNKLVKDVVELNRPFATTNDVDLEFHSEIDEIYCDVDANRFNQALTNLISNAVKFTMRFDTVEIRLHQNQSDQLMISVIDNGPGIDEAFKEKIFEKFTQGDGSSTKANGGSGLGLNITRSIVSAFNGEVTIETELNSGSTFSIVLPVLDHEHEEERRVA
ncbi:MAG: PAS domain-containing sensor histidine kinase [Pseudomonadota bacterium]